MLSKLPGASYLGEVSVFSPSKTWSEILRNDMVEGKFYKPFYKKNYRPEIESRVESGITNRARVQSTQT